MISMRNIISKINIINILLLLSPLMCDAQEGAQYKTQLKHLRIKNNCFKKMLLSNILQTKEDHVFLINFVPRNDTIFTYVGFAPKTFLPELCCSFGNLYIDNPLTGYFSCNKKNCYVFGESYRLFLKKTKKMIQVPNNISWLAHLSEIKSREDTLLPQLSLLIDGKNLRNIDGVYACDKAEYTLHIDPFLMVYAFHRRKFIPLGILDRYPYSVIEYIENKQ